MRTKRRSAESSARQGNNPLVKLVCNCDKCPRCKNRLNMRAKRALRPKYDRDLNRKPMERVRIPLEAIHIFGQTGSAF